ncbi:amino acid ABC transporter permease [Paenibacillus sp. HJGM_3]|uniref:amino acid ABC transporter permease n=1 Tax=Paenibacillus sp. HJGM_3 TaxID=3379816 RepID=UPI00385ED1F5
MTASIDLDFASAIASLPYLMKGLELTLLIAVFGLIIGFAIGLLAGLARLSRKRLLRVVSTVYVEAIRGTPLLVQAVWLFFGLNQLLVQTTGFRISSVQAGIIVIAVNAGAYIAEIVRGSIQSIDRGQDEAGRSLGLSKTQSFVHIVFPQAFKRMIPPLGNQFIISLKDTSLLSIIAVGELMRNGQEIVSTEFNAFEIYTIIAVMYLLLTLAISFILRSIERRIG